MNLRKLKKKPKQIGKIGKRNLEANALLKWIYIDRGIIRCEVGLKGCMIDNGLTFAHKHKRVEYLKEPKRLSEFSETVLACINCHDKMEVDRGLTKKIFEHLRG